MQKVAIFFILAGVFSSNLANAGTKEKCEEKGGKYCPGSGYPWSFPLTVFLRNPLPTSDKCLAFTAQSKAEFFTLSRCSLKGKAKVICEIHL
ncbi:hypothetical protein Anas_05416 [Armadillidium nasatum]|uniref:Uncharacterized protein n=1 Tax=Armadillidium nasatum TaxID=96803 RepID=A0A5N5TN89_9CRUS|nr:hypothetical protein Anas_05416 [Armadillidium nasatum]